MTGQFKIALLHLCFLSVLILGSGIVLEAQSKGDSSTQDASGPETESASAAPGEQAPPANEPDLKQPQEVPGNAEQKIYKGEKISREFTNVDIHKIIRIIGEVSGKNIVVSDSVNGQMTLKLKDVPWDQALDIVLSSQNLGVEESGNVMTVYDLPTLQKLRTRERVECVTPSRTPNTGLSKKVFTPKHAPIVKVAEELKKIKSERGKMVAIGNDIYVEDEPEAIAAMSKLFISLDQTARRILIEARLIEAGPTLTKALDLKWPGGRREADRELKNSGSEGQAESKAPGARLTYAYLSKAQSLALSAQLSAIESDSRTISAPRIMADNHQQVHIKQGTQIPYRSGSGASSSGCSSRQFKDEFLELNVTPHLEEDGQTLSLDFQVTFNNPKLTEPLLSLKEAGVKLSVKDGETIALGGLTLDSRSESKDGLEGGASYCLSDLMNIKDKELLIFVTAQIIPLDI